ncbi:DNA-directed RNA polymerases I, II, and III subunit RPABC5 [Tritrichomonas foetus]|uniref:DNA-directed RNA polymerases I, II, and III subunit RPABC5 n=1 Tax=Tritrichomonas foetus TaxID=1144522 RepID=A0A1J4JAF7_9EUKA|nr:DNA-directed RNA polymerases I, II, and III subunit RPABC5 [Tritrichomonas foetus]|eukprot:OHS94429.1 DNA-directed RNA polymerases I, II, and III subunit RPABC5 [Tritrichomonas foetus]
MLIPIRCFTCGAMIANKYESYCDLLKEGKTPEEALNILKIHRFCCRRMFLAHADLIDKMMPYSPADPDEVAKTSQS